MIQKVEEKTPIENFYIGFFDGPHATPQFVEEGPVFLGIKNITEDGRLDLAETNHLSEKDFQKWTRRVTPQAGDIVFTYEAVLHKYAIIPKGFRGCLGRRLALVRPNPQKADSKFLLYYFLGSYWKALITSKIFSGSTVDRIPLIDFPKFEVSIPPLAVQRKIAAVLSAYDDLIENNTRRIALLEKMAEEIYREWFVRLRFPGHEHVTFHKGIPDGWERKRFDEFCLLQRGFDITKKEQKDGDVPIVSSSGIASYHNKAKVKGPGVVTGRKGTLGKVYFVDSDYWPHDTTLWAKDTKGNSLYVIYYLLKSIPLEIYDAGASNPTLNRNHLGGQYLYTPPKSVQQAFEDTIKPIFQQRKLLENAREVLQQTRDRLLTRLISGKLSVADLDIHFPPSMTAEAHYEQ